METVKSTDKYTIFKKRNGRYAVQGTNRKWINGDEKAKILADEGLIKLSKPAPAEEIKEEAEATQEEAQADA